MKCAQYGLKMRCGEENAHTIYVQCNLTTTRLFRPCAAQQICGTATHLP
jgi:hypothetical protein